jgi:hypothetical protein
VYIVCGKEGIEYNIFIVWDFCLLDMLPSLLMGGAGIILTVILWIISFMVQTLLLQPSKILFPSVLLVGHVMGNPPQMSNLSVAAIRFWKIIYFIKAGHTEIDILHLYN